MTMCHDRLVRIRPPEMILEPPRGRLGRPPYVWRVLFDSPPPDTAIQLLFNLTASNYSTTNQTAGSGI